MSGDYSKVNKLLLIGGLLFYFWPQIRASFAGLGVSLPTFGDLTALTNAGLLGSARAPVDTAPPGGNVRPPAPSPIGAIGGAAAAGIAGLSGAAALAATGVLAIGAIIAWGVIKEGWFRGGEEGVVVNPARDAFLSQFAPLDYMRDNRNPPGFYGLAWLLEALVPGAGNGGAFVGVTSATGKSSFANAVTTVQGIIAANEAHARQLWEYAVRDPNAPQRAVTPAVAA